MNLTTNPSSAIGHMTTSPLFQTLVFVALILIFTILIIKPSKKPQYHLPPGPAPWPVVGNLPEMVRNRPAFRWIHTVMKDLKTEIACFRFGNTHVVSIISDVIAREVLKEKDLIFATRPDSFGVQTLSGNRRSCSFAPYGDHWKKMRKVLVSELNSSATLSWLHDRRAEAAENLLAYITKLCERSEPVNVRDIARHYCHRVALILTYGKPYLREATADGGPGPEEREHIESIFKCLDNVYSFHLSDYVSCWGMDLDGRKKTIKEACEALEKYDFPIINERMKLWKEGGGKKEVEDWLDILITLKNDDGTPLLTPEEIRAQIKEIMLAAVDNPSNNVEWVLAEMLNQPEILKKAMDELDSVVGKDRLVQESDIPNLNYIKACCREGFRMHPIAPFLVPHVALSDTTLAGYFIPKGTHIHISRIGLGRNPKIWAEPNRFKPERHLGIIDSCGSSEVVLAESEMRFVSFSTGRRSCIAVRLGSLMTFMLTARLLQGFKWSLPDANGSVPGRVDLTESPRSLFMAKPLVARAEPRLAPHLYPKAV